MLALSQSNLIYILHCKYNRGGQSFAARESGIVALLLAAFWNLASLAPASINLRLSAIRKLATEAAENGLLDRSVAQGIVSLKGARQSGDRARNRLTRAQARDLHVPSG